MTTAALTRLTDNRVYKQQKSFSVEINEYLDLHHQGESRQANCKEVDDRAHDARGNKVEEGILISAINGRVVVNWQLLCRR